MTTIIRLAALLLVAGSLSACAQRDSAQSDLSPRARTFAALPDWTGLWQTEIAKFYASNPSGHIEGGNELEELGISQWLDPPPYNAEWEQKYQEEKRNFSWANAAAAAKGCTPMGFPLAMDWINIFQVAVTPEETLFVFEDGTIRHIYTDGRSHPGNDELWPTPIGDSIGKWEGDTLVIDTVARTPGPVFPIPSANLSDQAHFTERVRRLDANTLENQITIDDPTRFKQPWQLTIRYSLVTELNRMVAYYYNCDNDRHPVGPDGKITVAPPR